MDPGSTNFYAEALAGLLQDLPPGAHAMALTGDARPEQIIQICRAEAKDAGEQFVLHAPTMGATVLNGAAQIAAFNPRTVNQELEDGGSGAVRRGAKYLLLVFADQVAKTTSWQAHVGNETAINRLERTRGRVICCYNDRALSELFQVQGLRAANAHSVLLPHPEP